MTKTAKAINFKIKKNGIANLSFDLKDEKVNKLTRDALLELEAILDEIKEDSKIKALIIESNKKDIFIAGADINEIKDITDKSDAYSKASLGQNIFNKIESLPFITIAVIGGACMGGGTELVLACDYRIATDYEKVKIGLPEVSLGIIPGFGGTQRLPRLVGLEESLKIILTGKPVDAKKAYKIGLVDLIVREEFLNDGLNLFIEDILKSPSSNKYISKRNSEAKKRYIKETLFGIKRLIFHFTKKSLLKKTKGHYPAPLSALKVVKKTYNISNKALGYNIEAQYFSDLATTPISKNLTELFFTSELIKKDSGIESDKKTNSPSPEPTMEPTAYKNTKTPSMEPTIEPTPGVSISSSLPHTTEDESSEIKNTTPSPSEANTTDKPTKKPPISPTNTAALITIGAILGIITIAGSTIYFVNKKRKNKLSKLQILELQSNKKIQEEIKQDPELGKVVKDIIYNEYLSGENSDKIEKKIRNPFVNIQGNVRDPFRKANKRKQKSDGFESSSSTIKSVWSEGHIDIKRNKNSNKPSKEIELVEMNNLNLSKIIQNDEEVVDELMDSGYIPTAGRDNDYDGDNEDEEKDNDQEVSSSSDIPSQGSIYKNKTKKGSQSKSNHLRKNSKSPSIKSEDEEVVDDINKTGGNDIGINIEIDDGLDNDDEKNQDYEEPELSHRNHSRTFIVRGSDDENEPSKSIKKSKVDKLADVSKSEKEKSDESTYL